LGGALSLLPAFPCRGGREDFLAYFRLTDFDGETRTFCLDPKPDTKHVGVDR
jgi:hypothetical protein